MAKNTAKQFLSIGMHIVPLENAVDFPPPTKIGACFASICLQISIKLT